VSGISPNCIGIRIGQETGREQAEGVQFLNPLAVFDVGLFAFDIFGLPAIDQNDIKTLPGSGTLWLIKAILKIVSI
jgi:hypothetical protein